MLMFAPVAALLSAAPASQNYGEQLLASELTRNPDLHYAAIDLEPSTDGHFQAGAREGSARAVVLPLTDALGNRIGTLSLIFAPSRGRAHAAGIAKDVSRHIYTKSGLADPDPFVPGGFHSATGQELIEQELVREPDLVTIAFHVALPGRDNRIIASNFGRIGKLGDADDQRVIATSNVLQEVTNAGKRLAVELPLLDRRGRTIGALSTSFIVGAHGRDAAYRSALRVQHDLSRAIPRLESLEK
jgi:hypothetical protein